MARTHRHGRSSHSHNPETMQKLWEQACRWGRISTRISGLYAERLWFTPWPTPTSARAAEREKTWVAGTSPLRIPFEGEELRGFTAGEGPTVLLVHGWGDHGPRLGAFIEPLTSARYTVVGVDLPAHGPGSVGSTNVYQLSRAIRATASAVQGIEGIIAHSMGVTASALAIRDGLDCRAIAALAVPTMRVEDAFEQFCTMLEMPPRTAAGLRWAIERRFGARTWQEVAEALGRHPGCPALVVHDRDDPLVPLSDGQAVAEAWGTRLHTTGELGHGKILRDDVVVRQVTEFIHDAVSDRGDKQAV